MSMTVQWGRITAGTAILISISWFLTFAPREKVLASSSAFEQSEELAKVQPSSWRSFASFADAFDRTDPSKTDSIVGWTPNCQIWPRSRYCGAGNELTLGPPTSEFDFQLAINIPMATQKINPPPPPYPHLATTVLYDDNAKALFSKCKMSSSKKAPNPCESVQGVDRPVKLVRAMWQEVNAKSSAILYIQKDFDQCNPSTNWTTACANMRRSIDAEAGQQCNLEDYPWRAKPIDMGCFPHILVTSQNRDLFKFPSGSATVGDNMILLAFHIMEFTPSKNAHRDWKESTFWWQARSGDSNLGLDCPNTGPCSRLKAPWRHFVMVTATLPKNMNDPILGAYNPYIEAPTGTQRNISCVVCHAFAGYPTQEAGLEQETGLSVGISRSILAQRLNTYLTTYNVTPTAEDWSLAFAIEVQTSNALPGNRAKEAKSAPLK
jgi:hypothetical protein